MPTLDVTDMLPKKWEPIQKRRFLAKFEGIDSFLIKTVSLPQISTEEIAINWINVTRYVAGKTTFSTMTLTMHNAVSPSAAQQLMLWQRSITEHVSGRSGYADFYKRDGQIDLLDPVGNVISRIEIRGAFITELNMNDMSYDSTNEISELSVTLRYDSMNLAF